MSTIDLITRYYAAFNRADWDQMLSLVSDDVVHDLNQGERQIGREAFAAFLARMARCYLEVLTDIRVMQSADGSHAAAEYVVSGQYLSSDEGLPPAMGQRYRLPGGRLLRRARGPHYPRHQLLQPAGLDRPGQGLSPAAALALWAVKNDPRVSAATIPRPVSVMPALC